MIRHKVGDALSTLVVIQRNLPIHAMQVGGGVV